MQSLYVCLFSNGHIKVGRSIDAESRIAQHADRVSCMGVELVNHFTAPCTGSAGKAEALLIAQCSGRATRRHKNEWFVGLDFDEVTQWAQDCASKLPVPNVEIGLAEIDFDQPDFPLILAHLKVAGKTQAEVAEACRCKQSTISDINSGRTKDPSFAVGSALVRLARSLQVEV
jgi:hypothetical protein